MSKSVISDCMGMFMSAQDQIQSRGTLKLKAMSCKMGQRIAETAIYGMQSLIWGTQEMASFV